MSVSEIRATAASGSLGITLRPEIRARLDQTYFYSSLARTGQTIFKQPHRADEGDWTALHAGYTELYENLLFNPLLRPSPARRRAPGLSTARQFFIKLSCRLHL